MELIYLRLLQRLLNAEYVYSWKYYTQLGNGRLETHGVHTNTWQSPLQLRLEIRKSS
jgi:hypothetical protein